MTVSTSTASSTTAVRMHQHGGSEQLRIETVPLSGPGPGEVLVDVTAAGVNFIDIYQREGLYPLPLPVTLGMEGAGSVVAVGSGAVGSGGHSVVPGARVAWLDVLGSYAGQAVLPADRLVPVPDALDLQLAAGAMLQGATADYLVRDTFALGQGHTALVHAAAGGVGLLLVQLARAAGARVIATVGSAEKEESVRAAGADEVIRYREVDFADEVERIVGPKAVDVVYDGVGRATFSGGLRVLRPRGLMVSFGNASGPVDPIAPLDLAKAGSLFLTRPTLAHYVVTATELRQRCGRVLAAVAEGALQVHIGHRFALGQAGTAHDLLQSRASSGKVLLLPD